MAVTLYSSVSDFKEWVKIPTAETTRDELIEACLAAASRQIDDKTGRRFWIDDAASARLFTPRGRVVSTDDGEMLLIDDLSAAPTLVEHGAGSSYNTVAADGYLTGPDNATVRGVAITSLTRTGSGWQSGLGQRVRVTGIWGWPTVPDPITQATLILATRLFKRKDSPEGVMGSADFGFIRMGRTDPDVQALIDPYILPGIA